MAAEAGAGGATLLGRRSECEALDRLLTDVVSGTSRVTVLRGDAGIGKSELLGYLSHRVAGWRVANAVGVESEMELAYSGLHQLCAPMLDHLDRLPTPQRDALASVFGLGVGVVPDRFLVGLATLSLLADAAEQQPLVCIVDDAQWLDQASAQILAFVGRRLLAERIALVCAARTGTGDEVLELPRTWRATDLAGGFGLPGSQLVASKIQQSYVRRLLLLPSDTQLLVLTAAAEPIGDRQLLHRAAETLGIDVAASHPGGGRRAAPHGLACGVRPSTRPIRHVPWGHCPRTGGAYILRSPRPRTPRRTRTGAPGIAPELRPDRTRRSPPSSSAPPDGHMLAEGSLLLPPFSPARPN